MSWTKWVMQQASQSVSPVQGAASASGEAKAALLAEIQAALDSLADTKMTTHTYTSMANVLHHCRDAITGRGYYGEAALAERAQAQPSGAVPALSDDDLCALEYAVKSLRAIAERQELTADTIEPLNDIRAASRRAKNAIARLEPVARRLCAATPAPEQESAQVAAVADGQSHVVPPSAAPAGQHGAAVALLADFVEFHASPVGMTPAVIEDIKAFAAQMADIDRRQADLIARAKAIITPVKPQSDYCPECDTVRPFHMPYCPAVARATATNTNQPENLGAANTNKGGDHV